MPPAIIGAGIAAGGTIAGGIMGANAQKDAANRQAALGREAAAGYSNIQLPTIEEQLLQLQEIKNAGNLTPEQEQLIQQQESVLNSYKANPEAYTAQMQALQGFKERSNEGLTATDKANVNQILSGINNANASNQAAIGQNMAQRGMSGSGSEMAQRLLSGQSAAQTASDQGFQVAAQSQQAKAAALQNLMAGGQAIENQQFGQAQGKAQAQNAVNQFNAQNAQNVMGQNVNRNNAAQAANLANQQQLNAANTDIANRQQIGNKSLYQSNFGNAITRQGGISNALNNQATAAGAQGQADANLWSGMGQGIGKIGSGLMEYGLDKKTAKFDPNTGKQIS